MADSHEEEILVLQQEMQVLKGRAGRRFLGEVANLWQSW